jgi:hypothetical protein
MWPWHGLLNTTLPLFLPSVSTKAGSISNKITKKRKYGAQGNSTLT